MFCKDLLHAASRKPVASNVDEVIGAAHDVHETVLINVARIASSVVAGVS